MHVQEDFSNFHSSPYENGRTFRTRRKGCFIPKALRLLAHISGPVFWLDPNLVYFQNQIWVKECSDSYLALVLKLSGKLDPVKNPCSMHKLNFFT